MLLRPGLALLAWASRHTLAYSVLSDPSLGALPDVLPSDFDIHNKTGLLAPILIPRVPGTEGSAAVRQHFANFFQQHLPSWSITWQNSTSTTPTSNGAEVPFINMIATRDPPWAKNSGNVGRLALVAHYDSLQTPSGFIGATDSAAPCAMLLHAARAIEQALERKWAAMMAAGEIDLELEEAKGIQILLLDGEEAFLHWTSTDSIYGARALASEWEATMHPAMSTYSTPLDSMELFVLLDLLGAAGPLVPSYFKTTHWAYKNMATLETRLRGLGKMRSKPPQPFLYEAGKKDDGMWLGGMVEDDHLPFQHKGVEILHLIPTPFPMVWHTPQDDGEHLHLDSVMDWATLTAAFAAEWMELDQFMASGVQPRAVAHDRSEL